ncbi:MAG: hypothetical protein V2B14_07005 [bacterium]
MSSYEKRRWYDKDPVLIKAMHILETSDNKFQIQMAINLIKIVIEHNIASNTYYSVDDIINAVEEGGCEKGNARWYDIDKTLRTAIQMLENCSEDAQSKIAQQIANLVAEKLRSADDEEEFSS